MWDLHLKQILVFLYDIIIFTGTLEDHDKCLLCVLNRLKECGIKLSPEKCKYFQSSVHYHGHIVFQKGVETAPRRYPVKYPGSSLKPY